MFNHSNLKLPAKIDGIIRRLIVTPDMHRIHHSQIGQEMNSNFGFNLSIWDRLFKSYEATPKHGHLDMKIGLHDFSHEQQGNILTLLAMPFSRK